MVPSLSLRAAKVVFSRPLVQHRRLDALGALAALLPRLMRKKLHLDCGLSAIASGPLSLSLAAWQGKTGVQSGTL